MMTGADSCDDCLPVAAKIGMVCLRVSSHRTVASRGKMLHFIYVKLSQTTVKAIEGALLI